MRRAVTLVVILICILCVLECDGGYRRRCQPRRKRYNKCRELCECSSDGSKWGNCVRQRKEFTTMTRRERKRYVEAVKTLSTESCIYHNTYNELITNHSVLFMSAIHNKIHFLSWHRWYLLQFENLLRQINCRITVPYWDWSAASGEPWGTEPDDLWYSGSTGFGGNGNSSNYYCISNGPFSGDWKPAPSVIPNCNRRRFYGNPPDYVAILELLEIAPENFTDFEMTLRVNFHNTIHCLIGGTMCSLDSSAAPEFFLHHAFVDKIWADWQNQSKNHMYAYFQELTVPLPGTGGLLPKVVVNNNKLLGNVRVDYLDINDTDTRSIKRRLKKLSRKKLRELQRNDFDDVDEESMRLFRVKPREFVKAKKGGKRFRPKNKKDRRRMKSRKGKRLGFDKEDLEEMEKQYKNEKNRVGGNHGKQGENRKTKPTSGSRNRGGGSGGKTTPQVGVKNYQQNGSRGGSGRGEGSTKSPNNAATTSSSSNYGGGDGKSTPQVGDKNNYQKSGTGGGSGRGGEGSTKSPNNAATTSSSSSNNGGGGAGGSNTDSVTTAAPTEAPSQVVVVYS